MAIRSHLVLHWAVDTQAAGVMVYCAGKKKSVKEKRELRKAKKKDPEVVTAAAARKPTPEELAAAGARLGPRAQVCCSVSSAAEPAEKPIGR